jgi:hypothetical protein
MVNTLLVRHFPTGGGRFTRTRACLVADSGREGVRARLSFMLTIRGCWFASRLPSVGVVIGTLLCGASAASGHALWLVQDNKPYESVTKSSKLYQDREAHTIRGVVQDIKTVKLENDEQFLQVSLKTPDEVVNVHLGPDWYMTEQIQHIEIIKGRELEIIGSGNVVAGTPVFVASEIRDDQRNERLRLRHRDGTPVWSGSERAH